MHTIIAVSGFLSEKSDLVGKWTPLREIAGHGAQYSLRWESRHLVALGEAFAAFGTKHLGKKALEYWAKRATRFAGEALRWPAMLLHAADLIDNPWSIAKDRAEKAGVLLGEALMQNAQGGRPVSLIGYSLGARVIFFALEHLAMKKAAGLVDHAILLGAAAPADPTRWNHASSVVAGRLVNGFSTSDWVLGLLYRSAAFTNDVAGLRAIDSEAVESIDLTTLAPGHTHYFPIPTEVLRRLRVHEL